MSTMNDGPAYEPQAHRWTSETERIARAAARRLFWERWERDLAAREAAHWARLRGEEREPGHPDH